ncbi:flagellar hook capping FlgD N-terminal domain-containing protein [Pseudarthrobacter sp. PS3-L1]|uniref:flagellar hook assembly protein FlgD n=1 Tax=Pseudarthrobacter sp. PS3-L1 TaxID=3046207 RepID=UPI0024BAF344|nr:flagellar hook capping FlgD N-terminal domain-containing protein [Pseudarthrobacter sp. PS3-L1]MDJ0319336.1 flagellar hook capping FlgD N-terminal domain-containing protein [Pseudarthrobacter sp. PS3-L1]
MTVQPVSGIGASTAAATPRNPAQSLDSEAFMSLLVAQLKNQSPSAPMDTNQMMSQTISLSMMEKTTEMAANSKEGFSLQMRSAAAALVGQHVDYTLPDGTAGSGVAGSVSYAGTVPTVTVGTVSIPLDAISGVGAAPTVPGTPPAPAVPPRQPQETMDI